MDGTARLFYLIIRNEHKDSMMTVEWFNWINKGKMMCHYLYCLLTHIPPWFPLNTLDRSDGTGRTNYYGILSPMIYQGQAVHKCICENGTSR